MSLVGKVALITGGASGLGLAAARRFGIAGANLCIAANNQDELERAGAILGKDGFEVMAMHVDLRRLSTVQAMVAAALDVFGRLDILVCAHSSAQPTETDWDKTIDLELNGCYRCSQAVLPLMRQQGWGRIIYVASPPVERGQPDWTAYASAKAGLIGLTRSLALEVVDQGITVNLLCPGEKLSEPEELADLMLYLAGESARGLTGQVMGMTVGAEW
jgi:NAD(P)-dependent dehydrogenase (short-subunit alcohol dehydrogenase family)